jgi:hypothetical protein
MMNANKPNPSGNVQAVKVKPITLGEFHKMIDNAPPKVRSLMLDIMNMPEGRRQEVCKATIELNKIINILSPKNLDRLLWWAEGLSTNSSQLEFMKANIETEGKVI